MNATMLLLYDLTRVCPPLYRLVCVVYGWGQPLRPGEEPGGARVASSARR
jgi:hypothetical protein